MNSAKFLVLAAILPFVTACPGHNNVQCRDNTSCDLTFGGSCLVAATGNRWCAYPDPACPSGSRYSDQDVGDGLGGECVPLGGGDDAGVDAPPDALPDSGVISGQYADLVIGQNDFTSNTANSGGQSASSLSGPISVATDGTRLWVGEGQNARVLQFNSLPVVSRPIANVVIGQAAANTSTNTTTQTTTRLGDVTVFSAGSRVFVADGTSNRVLIFSAIPTTNGQAAAIVLGQGSFTTSASGKSASGLYGPTDIWSDGTRLAVVDNANSRVLIWNSIPTANGQAADVVIGRSAFGLGISDGTADPPTNTSMKFPVGIWSNGTRLYVTDSGNHRVMVWNTFPTTNGAPCDFVLGQAAFNGNTANAGGATANAIGVQTPYKAIEANGQLFISDSVNHRVVVHSPIPTTSGEAADAVLGQDNLNSNTMPSTPTGNTMASPRMMTAIGAALYVPDYTWHRVLRFAI